MSTSCNEDNNIKNTAQIYLSKHGSAWNVHFDDIPQKITNWAASRPQLSYFMSQSILRTNWQTILQ